MTQRSASELWTAALGELQVQLSRANYDTWLRGTMGLALGEGSFTVGVPSAFAREWLQRRLSPLIRKTVCRVLGQETDIEFQVLGAAAMPPERPGMLLGGFEPAPDAAPAVRPLPLAAQCNLNPKYTFATFIVGATNRFAHAAALGVAESPGNSYNPFFIYGGVGLGKTHLLHAVGNHCRMDGRRVLYVTSEQFTNEFINALRERTTEEFRVRYRNADVLLIDDIHFIADKEQTQESFFHTFNDLHTADRQIVISSDRPPRSMPLLEDRLRSRFEWGLIADIQPPDLEMRLAILRSRAEDARATIPDDVLDLIAHHFTSNVRELEGALNRTLAYSRVVGSPLSLPVATAALAEMVPDPRSSAVSPATVIQAVASYFQVSLEELLGPRRSKDIALARQVAMYILRKETRLSLAEIGAELGGRDHSTVVHGCERIGAVAGESTALHRSLMEITARLRSS